MTTPVISSRLSWRWTTQILTRRAFLSIFCNIERHLHWNSSNIKFSDVRRYAKMVLELTLMEDDGTPEKMENDDSSGVSSRKL
jgi:hypothetical protein